MSHPKVLNFLIAITLIIALFRNGNASNIADDSVRSSEESSFVIHLLNAEMLKTEIISDIDSKLTEKIHSKLANLVSILKQYNDKLKNDINRRLEQQMKFVTESMHKIQKLLGKENPIIENSNSSCKKKLPQSCAKALTNSSNNTNGIYQLYLPDFDLKPFYVYCQQNLLTDNAWTIIQRRWDNSTDFFRNWDEYERGFGDLKSNFFIGLSKLYAMTNAQPHELWIHLEDFKGEKRFARYERFAIGNADEKYALQSLGKYSGDAGDSLSYHREMQFSAKDNDNDELNKNNCAILRKGAWWYKSCHESNLNGLYLQEGKSEYATGIVWEHWHGHNCSLKRVFMAIRPKYKPR